MPVRFLLPTLHMRIALLATMALWTLGCTLSGGGDVDVASPSGDDGGTVSPAEDTGGGADTSPSSAPADTGTTKPPPADSGGSATPTPTPPSGSLDAARVACVDGINAYRATLNLPPYAGWTSADACADGQAKSDSQTDTAHGAFGKCGESAQNECPGWPGPPDTMIASCLKMMWAEGPGQPFSEHGHYINMSSTSYGAVACGFYQTASGSWWAVQDFR